MKVNIPKFKQETLQKIEKDLGGQPNTETSGQSTEKLIFLKIKYNNHKDITLQHNGLKEFLSIGSKRKVAVNRLKSELIVDTLTSAHMGENC